MYVVSCADKTFYCGISNDVHQRVNDHNTKKKGAKYTRSRRPVVLMFVEEHDSRSSASKAEYRFKKLTRSQKIKYMAHACDERLQAEYLEWKSSQAV